MILVPFPFFGPMKSQTKIYNWSFKRNITGAFAKRGMSLINNMFTSLFRRAACLTYGFAKWSKPKPIPGRSKEQRTAKAIGDDKAAKLSKSELENEAKKKQQEDDHIEEQTKY